MEHLPDQPQDKTINCPQCGFELDLPPPVAGRSAAATMPKERSQRSIGATALVPSRAARQQLKESHNAEREHEGSAIGASPSISSGNNSFYVISGNAVVIAAASVRGAVSR